MENCQVLSNAQVEPILQYNTERFCMFPIKNAQVWEMYKKAEASFWTGSVYCLLVACCL
jgi:hypothetical protein